MDVCNWFGKDTPLEVYATGIPQRLCNDLYALSHCIKNFKRYNRFESRSIMETFFLDINQLVVGSIVLNAAIMASFFGVSLSQRSALHRLEVALNEKNSLLAGTSVAGLLSSSMQEIEDAPNLEVTELLDTESDDDSPNIEIDRPVLSDSLDYDQVPSGSSISESQIMIFYW